MDFPDKQAHITWLHALYGATMLSVQRLEQAISLVYAVANLEAGRRPNASTSRQWRNATARMWRAFQQGTAGMRLNDAKVGIKDQLAPKL